jgi:deoxycytidylate deaminase
VAFDLSSYEPVAERLDRWLNAKIAGYEASTNDYPRVLTRMVSEPGADICVIRAELWLGENIIATGYAEEVRGAGNVNRTSHVENCETSAIGRALANCGMAGSDMSKRPSREEMSKVQRTSNGPAVERGVDPKMPSVTVTQPAGLASEKQVYFAASFYKKAEREAPKKWLATLNKAEMSALIDDLKEGKFPEPDASEEPF